MSRRMFITAAPVGAVPKYVSPAEPKFLPAPPASSDTGSKGFVEESGRILEEAGWEQVSAGGLVSPTGYYSLPLRIPASVVDLVSSLRDRQEFVLILAASGWIFGDDGSIRQPNPVLQVYLPPRIVNTFQREYPAVVRTLVKQGWSAVGAGYWNPMRAASPHVPITPNAIIKASVDAAVQGAAIVHLHTRDTSDAVELKWPGVEQPVWISHQRNRIDVGQYESIVSALHRLIPSAIVNLSTSVRGAVDFESPVRRAHLKSYGTQSRSPDMASFSPGPVIFQTGGGYDNPPRFLEAQRAHFRSHNIRPEVEVFGRNMLEQALGADWGSLREAGEPVLFMLVAGVDQHRRIDGGGLVDDSLVPVAERKEIFRLLAEGSDVARRRATQRTVLHLRPIVDRIRSHSRSAVISALMPGPLLQILPEVAVGLGLDGVRVGLEDALNLPDHRVPGGLRKATTAEQVRYVRKRLERLGVVVENAEEVRDRLSMPLEDVSLFRAAAEALAPLLAIEPPARPRAIAHDVLAALGAIQAQYTAKEERFATYIRSHLEIRLKHDGATSADELAAVAVRSISEHGLYVRYFIEERDRYPAPLKDFGQRLHPLQALNFIRELLATRGEPSELWDGALQALAEVDGLAPEAYMVDPSQYKGQGLRFLEYLTSLPSRFNQTRTLAVNTVLRSDKNYSAVMATLFEAVHEKMSALRRSSRAEHKQPGTKILHVAGGAYAEIGDQALRRSLREHPWVALPSTPTTNYPEGVLLATGLTASFSRFLADITQCAKGLVGFVHPGLDDQGHPIIESAMLHNRFALNTPWHRHVVGHSARLLYEQLLMPRVVEKPELLARAADGTVHRDPSGLPVYGDGRPAARISFQRVEDLVRLHLFAHSSGVATIQQIDNLLRADLDALGYSVLEQDEIFNRAVAISFGSASDINLALSGTPIIDITAYNDIRCLAGTTSPDYLPKTEEELSATTHLLQEGVKEGHRYEHARWTLYRNGASRKLLRLKGVVLREDPVRMHDGHSIRRYLEGAPRSVFDLIRLFHDSPHTIRADMLMREFYSWQMAV